MICCAARLRRPIAAIDVKKSLWIMQGDF